MNKAWVLLAAVCALVCGIYMFTAQSGYVVSSSLDAADNYYNLLVAGFRAGQLGVKKAVPPAFAQLPDPYDPKANESYGLLDLSYYKGRLYLYYGITPVLLFWPYVVLTGHYLLQKDAVLLFCVVGFLASVGLLCALWRRYFAEVSVVTVAAGAIALGLATCISPLLARSDVWEVSISCGYAFTMLALAAIWGALHHPSRRGRWLAAASLAYGLAVGSRPNLLFGAVILLVPVVQARRERRPIGALLMAAIGPLSLIGLCLMIYNALRFDSPFEFGVHYVLAGHRQFGRRLFSLGYLWFSFRVYFLEPACWSSRFPFVHDVAVPRWPTGFAEVESPYGALTNIPLVWLALAVPLAWRGRSAETRSCLRGFLAAVAVVFGMCTLTLCSFFTASIRYEVEFVSPLVLLAIIGILGSERALASRPAWQYAARCGWGLLLAFSVAFNLLVSLQRSAEARDNRGVVLVRLGRLPEGIEQYTRALQLNPDSAEAHFNLGLALMKLNRAGEAIGQFEQALVVRPDLARAHNNLAVALVHSGRLQEGIGHYERALQIDPDYVEAHNNLGLALMKLDRVAEAIGQFGQALAISPGSAEAHDNLGVALVRSGRFPEGIEHYERALQLDPDYAEAHNNLGAALMRLNRVAEAIGHFEQALVIRPDLVVARDNLGNALLREGRASEAIGQYEQALRVDPDSAAVESDWGVALARLGRLPEAIGHYQRALRIDPNDAEAHYNLGNALLGTGNVPDAVAHYREALRIDPDDADSHNKLGEALMTMGRNREAIERLQQALRINPNLVEAQTNLAKLLAAPAD